MDNWIFKYHEAIQKKEVIVGVWVRLCFEILTTGLLNGEWEFNEKKANKAIKFIENFCHHSEGRSDLLHLELWQKAIVSAIFGIMDKTTGYRQFREVFIIVARKNGKTLFAAAIAAYMTYPAVAMDIINGCFLAPRAEVITSYCFNPWSPGHASISSLTTN